MQPITIARRNAARTQPCRIAAKLAIFSIIAMAASSDAALTHTHKNADGSETSWYPADCCHDRDCRPVAKIVRAPQGLWMTTVDGYTILVGPADRRLPSRDMRWHVCINSDFEAPADTVKCVFEPPST